MLIIIINDDHTSENSSHFAFSHIRKTDRQPPSANQSLSVFSPSSFSFVWTTGHHLRPLPNLVMVAGDTLKWKREKEICHFTLGRLWCGLILSTLAFLLSPPAHPSIHPSLPSLHHLHYIFARKDCSSWKRLSFKRRRRGKCQVCI